MVADLERDVVQFPAFGGTVGIERFEKLNSGCHDHRGIPIFCRKALIAFRSLDFFIRVQSRAGVMLNNIICTQNLPENRRILLDDGSIRNHINGPPHSVFDRMAKSKSQGGDSLPAASGNSQGIDPFGTCSRIQAVLQNLTAAAVYFIFGRKESRNMLFQFLQKCRQGIVTPSLNGTAGHEFLCVQIVRIH